MMTNIEAVSFDCPNCGFAVHLPRDGNTSMVCSACGRDIILPPEFRQPLQTAQSNDSPGALTPDQKKKILRELMLMLGLGKKADATKHYHDTFGVSLAEAKTQIDLLEQGLGIDLPDYVQTQPSRPAHVSEYQNPAVHIPPQQIKRRSSRVGVIFMLLGLLAACVAVLIGTKAPDILKGVLLSTTPGAAITIPTLSGSLFQKAPTLLDPAALVPVSDQPADMVLQARRFETDPYTTTLVRYEGATRKLLWETAPFSGKDVYLDEIFTDSDQAYVVIADKLFVFHLSDGKPTWTAKLTDKLGYCGADQSCAAIQEKVLLVLSTDDILQAFDTTSGSLLWQRRVFYSSKGINLFKNQIVIFDQDPQSNKSSIVLLNLTSGQEEMRITPTDMYGSSDILFSGDNLYLIGNQVIEKWDLSGTKPALSLQIKGDFFTMNNSGIIAADVLFFPGDHKIQAINLADGAGKDLIADADYDLQPLAISGSQLLVLAKKTRGTAKYELWNVDHRTGEKVVIDSFGESQMISDSFPSSESQDKYVWTWKLTGTTLVVVKFKANPNQAVIDSYDINTGKTLKSAAVSFDKITDDSYSIRSMIGWQGHILWVMLDTQVYGIDTQAGKIVSTFP